MTVIGITVFLGMAALAIDFGLLFSAQSEAQRAADAAAMAGAGYLAQHPGDGDGAEAEALELARSNFVRNEELVIGEDDVDVNTAEGLVEVRVRRDASHGGGISTLFAQTTGLDEVDIAVQATAQVFGGQAIHCALPLVIPDRWDNTGGPGFDPDEGDRYAPASEDGGTGYSNDDIGEIVTLIPEQAGGGNNNGNNNNNSNNNNEPPGTSTTFSNEWSGWWSPDGSNSTNNLIEWTRDCQDPDKRFQEGEWGETVPGRRQAVVNNGFQDLVNEDPEAHWDESCNCVQGGQGAQSPRIRPIVMFDPRSFQNGGSENFQFINFASVFVETTNEGGGQKGVRGRLMSVSGFVPEAIGGSAGSGSSLNTVVRLIE